MKVVAWVIFAMLLTIALGAWLAFGADVITFDPSPTTNVTYKLRWGVSSGTVTSFMDLGTNRSIILLDGPWGTNYYTIVAVSTNGIESYPSNEAVGTNRPSAPLNVRVTPAP